MLGRVLRVTYSFDEIGMWPLARGFVEVKTVAAWGVASWISWGRGEQGVRYEAIGLDKATSEILQDVCDLLTGSL